MQNNFQGITRHKFMNHPTARWPVVENWGFCNLLNEGEYQHEGSGTELRDASLTVTFTFDEETHKGISVAELKLYDDDMEEIHSTVFRDDKTNMGEVEYMLNRYFNVAINYAVDFYLKGER